MVGSFISFKNFKHVCHLLMFFLIQEVLCFQPRNTDCKREKERESKRVEVEKKRTNGNDGESAGVTGGI